MMYCFDRLYPASLNCNNTIFRYALRQLCEQVLQDVIVSVPVPVFQNRFAVRVRMFQNKFSVRDHALQSAFQITISMYC